MPKTGTPKLHPPICVKIVRWFTRFYLVRDYMLGADMRIPTAVKENHRDSSREGNNNMY